LRIQQKSRLQRLTSESAWVHTFGWVGLRLRLSLSCRPPRRTQN
jgi:hypothetical protein